jgi:hypothetical protein
MSQVMPQRMNRLTKYGVNGDDPLGNGPQPHSKTAPCAPNSLAMPIMRSIRATA